MKVYNNIKKLSDLGSIKSISNDMFVLLAHNRNNYKIPLTSIQQKKIVTSVQDITTESNVEVPIKLNFKDGSVIRLYLKNGNYGEIGRQGKIGPDGDKGDDPILRDNEDISGWLMIANDKITTDNSKVLSALQGVEMNEFIESISETFLTEYQYALLFTDHVTIEAEFETIENGQLVQLINSDPDSHQRYVKYWTFESDGEAEYFILNHFLSKPAEGDKPAELVYDSVYADLWDDIYMGGTKGYFSATTGQLTDGTQLYIKDNRNDCEYLPIEQYNESDESNTLEYGQREFLYYLKNADCDVMVKYDATTGYDFNLNATELKLNIYLFDQVVDGKATYKMVDKKDVNSKGNDVYYQKLEDGTFETISDVDSYIAKKPTRYYRLNGEHWVEVESLDNINIDNFEEYIVVDYASTTNTSTFTHYKHVKTAREEYYSSQTDIINPYTIDYYIYDDDRQYFTRRIITKIENGITTFDYEYNRIVVPFWLEAEFLTIDEDQNVRLLNADTKYDSDDEIIKPIYIESIEFESNSIEIAKNMNKNIPVTIYPSNANQTGMIIDYDDSLIKFFEDGRIAAIENDEITTHTTLKVYSENNSDIYDTLDIKVVTPVEDIILDTEQISIYPGSNHQLTWSIYPEVVSNPNVNFTLSDNNLITIDNNGLIQSKRNSNGEFSVGSTQLTITAADGFGVSKTINVLVANPVTSVKITSNDFGFVNQPFTIETQVLPDNATEKSLVYSTSDENILSISGDQCTPKSVGECTIYAKTTDGSNITASQNIKITIGVNEISFNDFNIDKLDIGLSKIVGINVIPENAANKDIKIVISDPSVLEYSNFTKLSDNVYSVKFTAIKNGTTQIMVQSVDGTGTLVTKDLDITIPMNSIDLGETDLIMYVGDDMKVLRPIIGPSDTSNTEIEWHTSNERIVTVDAQGRVTPQSAGVARISAISKDGNGVMATCNITVKTRVSSIELNNGDGNAIQLLTNNYGFINAVVSPDNATDQILEWTSSDNKICTVEDNGTIFGVKPGEVTITATSVDGVTASIAVKVTNKIDENI